MTYRDPGAATLLNRYTIRTPLVSHRWTGGEFWPYFRVDRSSHLSVRRAAELLAVQFRRETHFDVAPYSARSRSEDEHVLLFPAPRVFVAEATLVGGGMGVGRRSEQEGWRCNWVWVHAYFRGRRVVENAWPQAVVEFPGLELEGPFTPAAARLRDRLRRLEEGGGEARP